MGIVFNDSEDFTLGIELETQLVDRKTLGLTQNSTEIIDSLRGAVPDGSVKHELTMSNLEVISRVCRDVAEAERDLREKVSSVIKAAKTLDTLICYSSTHPFSRWQDQAITEEERYLQLVESLQMVARRFNIFGLHVHVGVMGGERCIYIMNRLLYYLPHLLAVSTNSPFWEGFDTGLKSYRVKVFENLPIAGLPFYFQNFSDYERLVESYLATGTIKTIRDLWWDVRPHPDFGTIEVRVCDIPSTLGETLSVAALIQALVKKFSDDYDRKVSFSRPHSAIIRENKWRACRYGVDGEFIAEEGFSVVKAKEALLRLLSSVRGEGKSLGSEKYLDGVEGIVERGTGAERQLSVWKEKGDLKAVVREQSGLLEKEVSPPAPAKGGNG